MDKTLLYTFVFLFSVFISSVSQILLKKSAMKKYVTWIQEYLNPLVIVAYIIFFLSTLLTMYSYRYVPLSMGPILESTGYIFVSVLGVIFLKEKLSRRELVGMFVIISGIAIFSL